MSSPFAIPFSTQYKKGKITKRCSNSTSLEFTIKASYGIGFTFDNFIIRNFQKL